MPSGEALRDAELRYYVILTLAVFGAFAAILWSAGSIDEHLARIAGFQAVFLLTATGFASAHFERWPALAQLIILQLMVLGAMAGSTCGGVKSLRVLLGLRALRSAFSVVGHRNAVRPAVRFAGRPVPPDVLAGIWTFFAAYFLLLAAAAGVLAASGSDLIRRFRPHSRRLGTWGPRSGRRGPTTASRTSRRR